MCVPTHAHLLCCPGHYVGKVRIKGEVRTSMLHERTSLSNLPSSKRKRQRSCFSVRVTDLVAAGVVGPAAAGVVPQNGDPHTVMHRVGSGSPHCEQPGAHGKRSVASAAVLACISA